MAFQKLEFGDSLSWENGYCKHGGDDNDCGTAPGAARKEACGPGGEDYLEIPTYIRRGILLSGCRERNNNLARQR